MNELVKINNHALQIKELDSKRVVTFKDIDFLHERVEGTAKRNFAENKKHFVENIDYFEVSTKSVPTLERFGFSKFAASGILITESGYLMLVKSLQDDLAWKVQRELVNNYFRVKEIVNLNNLSPELQMFKKIFDTVANQELKQKEFEQAITKTKEDVKAIREVVALNPSDWKRDTTKFINRMAVKLGSYQHIKPLREESYKLLEQRMAANLSIRLTNKKRRMAEEGVCKSKRNKLNKLDVISDDKRLIQGYIAIVKEMAIKYKVG